MAKNLEYTQLIIDKIVEKLQPVEVQKYQVSNDYNQGAQDSKDKIINFIKEIELWKSFKEKSEK